MKKEFNFKRGYTHAGGFHADDVFSTALIELICKVKGIDMIPIYRVFNVDKDLESDAIAYDIGGGRYDHHQEGAEVRENGNKYAAFGLLWRDFGYIVCSDSSARERIDEYFIQPLDLSDNFGNPNDLSEMISSFNPCWDETFSPDDSFWEAVSIAEKILKRKIIQQMGIAEAHKQVEEFLESSDGEIVVLDKFLPWRDVLIPSTAKFVVFPSKRGGYSAQVVPISKEVTTAKCDFPKEWGGLRNEELCEVAGMKGLVFCHSALFLLAAETKEAAIDGCKLALRLAKD